MTGPDRPAEVPRNCSNAGAKSRLDRPCRYSNGNTSVIFGLLRHHGGRIAEENRLRCPGGYARAHGSQDGAEVSAAGGGVLDEIVREAARAMLAAALRAEVTAY